MDRIEPTRIGILCVSIKDRTTNEVVRVAIYNTGQYDKTYED